VDSLQISNISGLPLMLFKWLSKLDRLRAVQHQYHIDIKGAGS